MTPARCGSRTASYTGLGTMTRRRSVAYRRKASTASMNATSKRSPCPWAAANDALARSARPTSDDRRRSDRGCREEGFELCWRPVGGRLCVGFERGDDERYPVFVEERLAISYMADWLRRGRVFA